MTLPVKLSAFNILQGTSNMLLNFFLLKMFLLKSIANERRMQLISGKYADPFGY
jgi:hypothetical protein